MKPAILILALVAMVIPAKAQDEASFQLGLRFDPNIGWLNTRLDIQDNTHEAENNGALPGFSAGISGDFNITNNYAVATEVRFSRVRGRLTYRNNDVLEPYSTDFTYNFRYIEVPIGLKLKTNEIGYFTFFGRVSVVPGININRRGDIESREGEDDYGKEDQDGDPYYGEDGSLDDINMEDDIRMIRAATEFALGTQYRLAGNTSLQASVSYNNSFINLIQNSPQDNDLRALRDDHDLNVTNRYIALNLGIMF